MISQKNNPKKYQNLKKVKTKRQHSPIKLEIKEDNLSRKRIHLHKSQVAIKRERRRQSTYLQIQKTNSLKNKRKLPRMKIMLNQLLKNP